MVEQAAYDALVPPGRTCPQPGATYDQRCTPFDLWGPLLRHYAITLLRYYAMLPFPPCTPTFSFYEVVLVRRCVLELAYTDVNKHTYANFNQ